MQTDGFGSGGAEPELRIDVAPDLEGRLVLNLHGVLDLHEVGELRPVLSEALALQGPELGPDVVVDLTELTFIGSSGMVALVQAHQDLDKQGRRLILRGASGRIRKAFEITHLDRVFVFEEGPDT